MQRKERWKKHSKGLESLGSKEKQKEQRDWGELKTEKVGKWDFAVREGGIRGKEGKITEKKIKLSPPCKHLGMNYLDPETLLLNTKHLINT